MAERQVAPHAGDRVGEPVVPATAERSTASQQLAEALRVGIVDRWQAFPWQVPALADTKPVVLLTGSVGGGKSHLWQRDAEQLHAPDNPGAFGPGGAARRASP